VCLYKNIILVIPVLSGEKLHPALLDEVPVYSYNDLGQERFLHSTAENVYYSEGLPAYVEMEPSKQVVLPHSPCDVHWLTHISIGSEGDAIQRSDQKSSCSLQPTLSSDEIDTCIFVESAEMDVELREGLKWTEGANRKRKNTNTDVGPAKKKATLVYILLFYLLLVCYDTNT